MLLMSGRKLGRYRVDRVLGEGGMGVVYLAEDERLQRLVALKLLRLAVRGPGDEHAQARLVREARAVAALKHPNIIEVFDVEEYDGQVVVAMEYFEGASLRRWAEDASPTLDQVLDVFIAVAGAISAAHGSGFLHRDIKPENILVDAHGDSRLLDFGLAMNSANLSDNGGSSEDRLSEQEEPPNAKTRRGGAIVGTIPFMARELLEGGEPSAATDAWAFFATLYEVLCGRRHRPGRTVLEVTAAPWKPPDFQGVDLPRTLERLIAQGLSPTPSERPANFKLIASGLKSIRHRKRTRRVVGLAAATAVAGAALGYFPASDADDRKCRRLAQRIETTWNDASRSELQAAFSATNTDFGQPALADVEPALDAFARAWAPLRLEVCRAEFSPEVDVDAPVVRGQAQCLDRLLWSFESTVQSLRSGGLVGISRAAELVEELDLPADCLDPERQVWVAPAPRSRDTPEQLESVRSSVARAEAALAAGDLEGAKAWADRADEERAALSDPILDAEVELARAQTLDAMRQPEDAERAYRNAIAAAEQAQYRRIRWESSLGLSALLAHQQRRFEAAAEVLRSAEAMLPTLDDAKLELRLIHAQATVALEAEEFERARGLLERLLASEAACKGCVDLIEVMHQIAESWIREDLSLAKAGLGEALELAEERYGQDHPRVADLLVSVGRVATFLRDLDYAREVLQRARKIRKTVFGESSVGVGQVEYALGSLAVRENDDQAAIEHLRRAAEIYRAAGNVSRFDTATVHSALGVVESRRGNFAEAARLQRLAIDDVIDQVGPDHPRLALPWVNLASNAERRERWSEALDAYQHAAAVSDTPMWRDRLAVSQASMLLQLGRTDEAAELIDAVSDRIPNSRPEWRRVRVAGAEIARRRGEDADAVRQVAELVPALREGAESPSSVSAAVGDNLLAADILWLQPGHRRDARGLAELSLALLEDAGPGEERLKKRVVVWLGEHPG